MAAAEASHVCKWKGCGNAHTNLKGLVDHLHNVHIDGQQVSSPSSKQLNCLWEGCWRNKPYTARLHLIEHLRAHTGERPYKCPIKGCNKTFSIECNAITHSRTPHHNNRHRGGAKPKASRQKPTKLKSLAKPLKPLAPRAAKTVALSATSQRQAQTRGLRTKLERQSIDVEFPLVPNSASTLSSARSSTEIPSLPSPGSKFYQDSLASLSASRVPRQPLIVHNTFNSPQPDRLGCMMHGVPFWGVELHLTSQPFLNSHLGYTVPGIVAKLPETPEKIPRKRVGLQDYTVSRINTIRADLISLSQDPLASMNLQNDILRLDSRLSNLLEG